MNHLTLIRDSLSFYFGRADLHMMLEKFKALLLPFITFFFETQDRFLYDVNGVVHVGANVGQERHLYRFHGLDVVWIEPIPSVFDQLKSNIGGIKNQLAIQALVLDEDNKEYEFHIANNIGQSSSILKFKEHKDIWPRIDYVQSIGLESVTLATLFKTQKLEPTKYQALILDTQGSELLVLQGSLPLLSHFRYVKIEVADFEAYQDCCQLSDVSNFMTSQGYQEISRRKFAGRTNVGSYFDIVYKRTY